MANELTIVAWHWGKKYPSVYLDRLEAGLHRHLKQPFRFVVATPDPADPLLQLPGCLVRLKMFSEAWQDEHRIDERFVCIDLDVIAVGPLDPLFDREEPFVILSGANAANPCPFNGSIMMLTRGHRPDVWADFTLEALGQIPKYHFPDDQGWIAVKIPDAAVWRCGPWSGIYAFKKPQWPSGDALPKDARLVVFPGARDPQQFLYLDWIRQHWTT